jgi:hypothetical protein
MDNHKKVVSPTPTPQFATASPTLVVAPPQQEEDTNLIAQKYWSEANVAILVQLHRKYFATEETRHNPDNWNLLTKEYNAISSDSRPKKSIMDRWDKLMRKYNAERSCMALQQHNNTAISNTAMPIVSYWNHFQYIDSYLGHLPIPDDIIYKNARYEENDNDYDDVVIRNKRPRSESEEPQRKKNTVDTQRLLMEQTLSSQQLQIDLIKKNYDAMAHMNMKFIEICEKVTTQQHNNENRYLNLLEKYMLLDKSNNRNNIPKVVEEAEHDF